MSTQKFIYILEIETTNKDGFEHIDQMFFSSEKKLSIIIYMVARRIITI